MAKEIIKAGSKTGTTKNETKPKALTAAEKKALADAEKARKAAEKAAADKKTAQAEVSVVKQQNEVLKDEKKSLQGTVDDLHEKWEAAKAELQNVKDSVVHVTHETTGYVIGRKNYWVFAAVPVIILGVWIFFLNRHNNNLEKTVQDKNTVIESKDRQIQNLKDEVNYDTTHAANNGIQVPDAAESKKKILTGNKP